MCVPRSIACAKRAGATLASEMTSISLQPIRFVVEHRDVAGRSEPTLHVYGATQGGPELLRFDCFEQGAHWHLDPEHRDVIQSLDEGVDAIEWTLSELRGDLFGLLERAGFRSDDLPEPSELADALEAVERAMRNPPLDLDGVRPSARRSSRGEKWTTFPEDVLPAWVADMDFPVAEPIRRMLRTAVDRSDLGYPVHPAPTDIPEIVAARMERRFGWRPEPGNVERRE